MENILKKALGEVLTPLYSEELRDIYDTGYKPSENFESKMRQLVKKTDKPPVFRYTRYLAAAAAIVIAVGAALLVPTLMNGRVEVDPGVTESTSESITTSDTKYSGTLTLTDDTDSVPSVETGVKESTSDDADAVIDIVTDDTTADSSATSVSEETETSAVTVVSTVSEEITDVNPGAGADVSADDTAGSTAIVTPPEDVNNDTTAEIISDDVEDDAVDDDVSLDVEDDDVDYVDGDDDAAIIVDTDSAVNISAEEGETLAELFGKNSIDVSFDDLYALTALFYPDNAHGGVSINMSTSEHAFIHEFVHKLGSAVAKYEEPSVEGGRYIQLSIHDFKPGHYEMNDAYYNWSAWGHYSDFFGMSDDEDTFGDEVDPDVTDDSNDTIGFGVKIYENTGAIEFYGLLWYNAQNGEADRSYRINPTFYMDKETVAALFADIDKMYIPENVSTVADITSAFDLTDANILQSSANVRGIYDTNLENGRSGSYIIDLLARYAGKKLSKVGNGAGTSPVWFNVITKNDHELFIYISYDGYIYLFDPVKTTYRFRYDDGEIEKALKAIAEANGFTVPQYSTLGEYLSDKHFTSISQIQYSDSSGTTYILDDAQELKAFTKLLKSEFKTAKYTYDPSETEGSFAVQIYIPGYMNYIRLFTQDSGNIMIRTNSSNWFKPSDGFAEKFLKLFMDNEKTRNNKRNDEDNMVDDDEKDDITPIIEVDDVNPLT